MRDFWRVPYYETTPANTILCTPCIIIFYFHENNESIQILLKIKNPAISCRIVIDVGNEGLFHVPHDETTPARTILCTTCITIFYFHEKEGSRSIVGDYA